MSDDKPSPNTNVITIDDARIGCLLDCVVRGGDVATRWAQTRTGCAIHSTKTVPAPSRTQPSHCECKPSFTSGPSRLRSSKTAGAARARSVQSKCVRPVLVNGDTVVVRWIFQFEWKDRSMTRMEELACALLPSADMCCTRTLTSIGLTRTSSVLMPP
jgi:hypothetical protein